MQEARGQRPEARGRIFLVSCFVLLASCFFIPAKAKGVERDPYSFNRLLLKVELIYEKQKKIYENDKSVYSASKKDEEFSTFRQRYNLEVKGKLLSRKLLIYDAGIEFDDKTESGTRGDLELDVRKYKLQTTILPKSNMPLTLFANRNSTETIYPAYKREETIDNYGFNWSWMLRFKTLPTTKLSVNKQYTQGIGTDAEALSYGVDMRKNIGPTENRFNYSAGDSKDNIGNSGSDYSDITFSNKTAFSDDTDFSFGIVENNSSVFSKDRKDDSSALAGSMDLKTKPTGRFSQQYNYTFVQSDIKTESETWGTDSEYFSGNVDYNPTKGFNTFANVNASNFETYTGSETSAAENVSLATGASYGQEINKELSLTESIG